MQNLPPVRLIATDLDGTLLGSDHNISPENLQALRDAQRAGMVVAICTGRCPEDVSLMLLEYGLCCPIIGLNGAHILDAPLGACVARHFMREDAARAVADALERSGEGFAAFADHRVVLRRFPERHSAQLRWGERLEAETGLCYREGAEEMRRVAQAGVFKFIVVNRARPQALALARRALAGIAGISLTASHFTNIEIMPRGVDKGRGLGALAASLGIPMAQVMAFGDNDNDLPMLLAAGYGTAMGNATAQVRAAARYITATNDEHGVAAAIRRFALAR